MSLEYFYKYCLNNKTNKKDDFWERKGSDGMS